MITNVATALLLLLPTEEEAEAPAAFLATDIADVDVTAEAGGLGEEPLIAASGIAAAKRLLSVLLVLAVVVGVRSIPVGEWVEGIGSESAFAAGEEDRLDDLSVLLVVVLFVMC